MKKINHWRQAAKNTGLFLFLGTFVLGLFAAKSPSDDTRSGFSIFTVAHADLPGGQETPLDPFGGATANGTSSGSCGDD